MKILDMLADGNEQAKEIMKAQVLDWGIGGLFFFSSLHFYPDYFRGQVIVDIAKVFSEIDGPKEGKNLREFMRYLMWEKRNIPPVEEIHKYFMELGIGGLWSTYENRFKAIFDKQLSMTAKCQNCGNMYDPAHGYGTTHCTEKCFREAVKALDSFGG